MVSGLVDEGPGTDWWDLQLSLRKESPQSPHENNLKEQTAFLDPVVNGKNVSVRFTLTVVFGKLSAWFAID